ncbi:hypothetical protein GCM10022288_14020 [Gryllotalpicola kribbensis]|uniref:HNH nuclease domain-containing protein n=1 Tax=Gryllotalpicola kribbensis TaxID=993084 RepID=A0ABP8AQG8_9MICO
MRGSLDSALAATEAQKRYELRSFRRVVRASGMAHYDIDLDPESDARFYGPIRRLLSPRFGGPRFTKSDDIARAEELEHDARTNEQLQVDTLVDLVDRAVRHDNGDLFRSHEPQVMVAVTTGDLEKARETEAAVRRHLTGDHAACPGAAHTGAAFRINRADCPGPDGGIAWIDGRDEPITAADALRMLCDRGYTPALFDETGHAIDIGKDQRYFTRKQRRAIAKRDGRCLYPGCDRPPEDCEYHHVNPWAAHPSHRKSEVRDGVLLCRRHHKLLHDFAARIERRGSEYWLYWPGKVAARLHSKSGVQVQLHLSRRQT